MAKARITPDERILSLVICLLHAPQYVTAEYIHKQVSGYASSKSPESFKRMFERDKQSLREMGVPIISGLTPDGVEGYRIDPASYALPEITLDQQEAAAIAMAVAFWEVPEVAALSRTAMLKL
ncbi:MAG: WYL domain-containing protein, partial [Gordonia amarae]